VYVTLGFLDLEQEDENGNSLVEKQPSVHAEVSDGHLVDVPIHGEVLLNLIADRHLWGSIYSQTQECPIYARHRTETLFRHPICIN
jgi:hypothetical protein